MRKFSFIILVCAVSFFALLPNYSSALTVGPGKLEYSTDPNTNINGNFFLFNENNEAKTFYPVFEKFIEENGEKRFLREESDLATWVKTATSVALSAKEQKEVPFTIEVPENAPPGGHFAVIWWSTAPPNASGTERVSIVTRVGVLVLLRVSGDIREEAELLKFDTSRRLFGSSIGQWLRLFGGLPVSFDVVFLNKSNVYVKPRGEIVIKDIFGRTKTTIGVNNTDLQILPESKRSFTVEWRETKFAFGPYKANLDLTYGESKKSLESSFWFVVIPWKAMVLVLLGLFFVFWGIPTMVKRYNRWIIKKAQNEK